MSLKKIERNVHKEYRTWKVENMSETFSKVDPDASRFKYYPVRKTYKFSTKVQGHAVEWVVTLNFCYNELLTGFKIDFNAVKKLKPKHHVTCNFYLVDADENKFFLGRKNRRFDSTYYYFPRIYSTCFGHCPKLPNTIDKLLPNDIMTLQIELITYLDDDPIFPYEQMSYRYDPEPSLSHDFSELYKVQDDRDVMINVQGVTFPVHKRVLKTRCPKLYEMVDYHQHMSDGNDNQVALTDIKPEIFRRVLEFIYTRKVEDLDDHAEDLLKVASKYKLRRLKYLCEFSLMEHYLTYENSEEVKNLAMSIGAKQLFQNANMLEMNARFKIEAYQLNLDDGILAELSLYPIRLSLHL